MKNTTIKKTVALTVAMSLGLSTTACTEQERMMATVAGLVGGAAVVGLVASGSGGAAGSSKAVSGSSGSNALPSTPSKKKGANDDSPYMPRLKSLYREAQDTYEKLLPSYERINLKKRIVFAEEFFGDVRYTDASLKNAIDNLEKELRDAQPLVADKAKFEELPVYNTEFKDLSLDEQRRYADAVIRSYEPGNPGSRTAKEVLGWGTPEFKAAQARAKKYEDEAYRRAVDGTIEDYQPVATADDVRVLAPYVRLSDAVTEAALPRLTRMNSKLKGNTSHAIPLDQEGKTNHVLHSIVQHGLLRAQKKGKSVGENTHHIGDTILSAFDGKNFRSENLAQFPVDMSADVTPDSIGATAEIAYLLEYQNLGGEGVTGHLFNIMVNDYHYTSVYVPDETSDGFYAVISTSSQVSQENAESIYGWGTDQTLPDGATEDSHE